MTRRGAPSKRTRDNDPWLQQGLWTPKFQWQPPRLDELPSWRDAKRVAIDVECRDPDLSRLGCGARRKDAYICGISFNIEDDPNSYYLPIRHQNPADNLPVEHVLQYFRDQVACFSGVVGGHSLQYDLDHLGTDGIVFDSSRVRFADAAVGDALLYELHKGYHLDDILERRGFPKKDERLLREAAESYGIHPKRDLWRMPAAAVGPYGEGDVRDLHPLIRQVEAEIEDKGIWQAWETECYVLPALLRMTQRGVRIDLKHLDHVAELAIKTIAEELAHIKSLCGFSVRSIMNARELEPCLRSIGIKVPHNFGPDKKTGVIVDRGPSIKKELLEAHKKHPLVAAIIRCRKWEKLLNTYVKGVREHLIGDRLHPSYRQIISPSDDQDSDDTEGTISTRTASRHPNVQAQPTRDPETGKLWRSIYLPEDDDSCFVVVDLASQEPRLTVHFAELQEANKPGSMPRATVFGDKFRSNPATDMHAMSAGFTGLPRSDAKIVFLAYAYGQGSGKAADSLGLPTIEGISKRTGRPYRAAGPEAQRILDKFDREVPFVKRLANLCKEVAKLRGNIRLIDGRFLHFERRPDGSIEDEHKAMNKLIQGSAAVQLKLALIALDRAGKDPRLTVHDENDFSIRRSRMRHEVREIKELTLGALSLTVPSLCDVEQGENYGRIHKYDPDVAESIEAFSRALAA